MKTLAGRIALVSGATRGAGRGIACMLGEAGATVYCSGRSSRSQPRQAAPVASPFCLAARPETIEETAEMVDARGGTGIALRVDHSDVAQVEDLMARIRSDHGHLDILVNDIWGGDELTEWGRPLWELDVQQGLTLLQRSVHTHIITSRYALPLMLTQRGGLIVEITDGDHYNYRGNFFYDLAKLSVIRLAYALAQELRDHDITAVAMTPGFLRSEAMLQHFGVSEAHWQDAGKQDPHFLASESPFYIGRAVAHLAADPDRAARSGSILSSWQLARAYKFTDIDGRRPDWGSYYAEHIAAPI